MSIGITACSIIMDVALVIKTAERYFVYFVATKLMVLNLVYLSIFSGLAALMGADIARNL